MFCKLKKKTANHLKDGQVGSDSIGFLFDRIKQYNTTQPKSKRGFLIGEIEKEMATHSSLAWRIPWTEEPGGLQSTGSQIVGHNGVTNTL